MIYDPEKHNRRSMRLKGYDYSQPGFYYVTICTQDRVERFGDVQNGKMIVNEAGEMVHAAWNRIPERYEHVVMDEYQIMPNHMHGILQIIFLENGGRQIIDPGNVGTGLVPVLNEQDESIKTRHNDVDEPNAPVFNDGDETFANGPIEGDKTLAITSGNVIAASRRMGT